MIRSIDDKSLLYFWMAAIFVLTIIAYQPAIHAGFIWDDDDYITDNGTLRTWDGLKRIWTERGAVPQYYPLVHTSYWLEYHLWGLNPKGYHVVNIILHALNAILAGLILRQLHFTGFFLVGILFAIHPVHAESVVWITERKNLLSAFFYLASMLVYIKCFPLTFANTQTVEVSKSFPQVARLTISNWVYYLLSLFLYGCALLSKTVTSTLPAAILLLIWWKRNKVSLLNIVSLLPFFLIGLMLSLNTIWMERNHVGALGPEWAYTFIERCLIAGRALWFYTSKLVYPINLTFNYPKWQINSQVLWQYVFPVTVLIVMIILWKLRRRIGRGPLVAVFFFGGTLLPALGFINYYPMLYSFVADHLQYLASLGLISLFVAVVVRLSSIYENQRRKFFVSIGKGILIVALVFLTWQQSHIYKNVESLWRDTIKKNPDTLLGHYNLGNYLVRQGNFAEAIIHYTEALRIKPDDPQIHYNLGNVYTKYDKLDLAIIEYKRVITLQPNHPRAHHKLGIALGKKGLHEEANQAMKRGRSPGSVKSYK